jgi:hypothetical protein
MCDRRTQVHENRKITPILDQKYGRHVAARFSCARFLKELRDLAGISDLDTLSCWYGTNLDRVMKTSSRRREPHWTESIAVGSRDFVHRIAALAKNRKRLEIGEWADSAWYVRKQGVHGRQP